MSEASNYVCINCGVGSQQLFKEFAGGTIQISHCAHCGKVVDKYIEWDGVLIFLDALLHKAEAYRHLLFNSTNIHKIQWKLLLILLICDAYMKYDISRSETYVESTPWIFDAAMEWHFYLVFTLALIEWLIFVASVLLFTLVMNRFAAVNSDLSMLAVIEGLIISSFGKLLALPAMVWGQTHSPQYLLLTKVFIFTSNVTAFKVVSRTNRFVAIVIIGSALIVQNVVGNFCLTHSDLLSM